MSTDQKGSAQVDTSNASGEANEQSIDSKDVVSYDTYKRTLAEAKAAKEKAAAEKIAKNAADAKAEWDASVLEFEQDQKNAWVSAEAARKVSEKRAAIAQTAKENANAAKVAANSKEAAGEDATDAKHLAYLADKKFTQAAEMATTGGKSNKFRLTRKKQSRRSNKKTRGKK
jgi:colicin import membrane protein